MSDRMDAAMRDIEDANQLSIVTIAGNLVTLRKNGNRELCGPCPVCKAGDDRFWVIIKENRCGCRKCDRGWSVVGLYAAAFGIRPHAAALELLGREKVAREIQRAEPRVTPKPPEDEWKTDLWQDEARQALKTASEMGKAWRGLTPETLKAFGCRFTASKFDVKYGKNRPSVIIPWISGDGQIYSLKYRFTNEREGLRYTSKGGGEPIVFGEHLLKRNDVLVLIEGEVNAMSVWQECHGFADVLSIGGDANTPAKEYAKLIAENRGYDVVLVWMDELSKAQKLVELFDPVPVRAFISPSGMDANDILGIGDSWLRDRIRTALDPKVCSICLGRGYTIKTGLTIICDCRRGL